MDYELAQEMERGEWSDDCYFVAHDESELAAIIEGVGFGHTILKDTPRGCGFEFGRTMSGRYILLADAFLDGDENEPNPDFHECRYDTALDGVRHFTINGKRLIDCVKGCRIYWNDAPMFFDD